MFREISMNLSHDLKVIYKYVTNSDYRFLVDSKLNLNNKMDDMTYLKRMFRARLGYDLNLDNPKSFNEKMQYLKLHDRNPYYTNLVDKYEVKKIVSEKIGSEHIIPMLGIWTTYKDIDFGGLPNQFVLKCTHDSGGLMICRDKKVFNNKVAKKIITNSLRRNFYYLGREWPYKNIKPRIIAEKYMDSGNGELVDYKFMCFNGVVKCVFTCTERYKDGGLKVTFFDRNWEELPFERHYPKSKVKIVKPCCLEEMINIAEKLSEGIPFVRVDLYEIQGNIYFGEYTFNPGGGFEEFDPLDWDYKLGEWISL